MKDTVVSSASSKSENEEKKCIDAILWIGEQYYPEILCDKKPIKPPNFKYPPNDPWPQDCLVHEAEIRGCCRKVPIIPNWMIPGESRIFLVHQNKKNKACCSLFGYYIFKRAEIVVPKVVSAPPAGSIYVPHSVTDFEAFRSCGRRPNRKSDKKAIYLVDALAADITDTFTLGTGTFEDAVKNACRRYKSPVTTLHARIRGNAELRGELVLFNEINGAYPTIARRPLAFMRNLARIDGEKLFEEIEEWYNKKGYYTPRAPYCGYDKKYTPAYCAFMFGLNITCAEVHCRAILGLAPGNSSTIPGIGKFTNIGGKINFKPLIKCEDC